MNRRQDPGGRGRGLLKRGYLHHGFPGLDTPSFPDGGGVGPHYDHYDVFLLQWGYRPAEPSVLALLASMFLHGGWLHLLGNMLFLWIYGDNVEHRLGPLSFVLWYLITGVAATLFHAVFFFSSDVPLVGASGAISGVLGFYFVWFPKNTVRVWVFFFPFLMDVIEIPARIVLAIYVIVDNLLPVFLGSSGASAVRFSMPVSVTTTVSSTRM